MNFFLFLFAGFAYGRQLATGLLILMAAMVVMELFSRLLRAFVL